MGENGLFKRSIRYNQVRVEAEYSRFNDQVRGGEHSEREEKGRMVGFGDRKVISRWGDHQGEFHKGGVTNSFGTKERCRFQSYCRSENDQQWYRRHTLQDGDVAKSTEVSEEGTICSKDRLSQWLSSCQDSRGQHRLPGDPMERNYLQVPSTTIWVEHSASGIHKNRERDVEKVEGHLQHNNLRLHRRFFNSGQRLFGGSKVVMYCNEGFGVAGLDGKEREVRTNPHPGDQVFRDGTEFRSGNSFSPGRESRELFFHGPVHGKLQEEESKGGIEVPGRSGGEDGFIHSGMPLVETLNPRITRSDHINVKKERLEWKNTAEQGHDWIINERFSDIEIEESNGIRTGE